MPRRHDHLFGRIANFQALHAAARRGACRRVVRGGSWNNNPRNLRSANRNRNTTDNRNNNIGFRVGSTLSARADTITVVSGAH
jgi:formylglycine-generating enzyme required for sulfatase activity